MQHPKKGIDARLRAAADLALEAVRDRTAPLVADVGCDHGYLTAYLLRQRPDLTAVASDVSALSLRKAQLLLDPGLYGSRVSFRVADGLSALADGEKPDCIVMAGMGGRLILGMLRDGRARLPGAALVLQANTDLPLLRAGLAELGAAVLMERYAEANGRVYAVLLARVRPGGADAPPDEREALLGAGAKDAGRVMYLTSLRQERTERMRKAAEKRTPQGIRKMEEADRENRWIAEELGMKPCTMEDLVSMVGALAPYDTAEEWDNVGMLLGRKKAGVRRALVALDVTREVLEEAKALGCQAIVTHHPFMFRAVRKVTDDTREGALMLDMAAAGIAHVAAHTNLDKAEGGVNDVLIARAGCVNVRGEGFIRVGDLPEPVSFGTLSARIAEALNAQVRTYGNPDATVHALGCCSGAGSDSYREAMALGADCFLTGEVRHNVALDAVHDGCPMIEAGHYETERPVCAGLCGALQKSADALQYDVTFFCSNADPFGRGK